MPAMGADAFAVCRPGEFLAGLISIPGIFAWSIPAIGADGFAACPAEEFVAGRPLMPGIFE